MACQENMLFWPLNLLPGFTHMHLALFAPLANSISSGSEQYPGRPQSPHYLWRQNRDCCVVEGWTQFWRLCGNKPAAQAAGQTLTDATPPIGKLHLLQQNRCNI